MRPPLEGGAAVRISSAGAGLASLGGMSLGNGGGVCRAHNIDSVPGPAMAFYSTNMFTSSTIQYNTVQEIMVGICIWIGICVLTHMFIWI